jgi:hypothetical protein
MAAIRVKGHYLAAQYRRLKPRRGHKKALGAVKHTMICAIWHMLATGETYRDLGGDYFTNRDPQRQTKRLVAQLQRLGHHVTLTDGARDSLNELFLPGKGNSPGVAISSRQGPSSVGPANSPPTRRASASVAPRYLRNRRSSTRCALQERAGQRTARDVTRGRVPTGRSQFSLCEGVRWCGR